MRLKELHSILLLEASVTSFENWLARERKKNPEAALSADSELLHQWFEVKLKGNLDSLTRINLDNAISKMKKWQEKKPDAYYNEKDDGVVYVHEPTGLIVYKLKPEDCKEEGQIMQNCASDYEDEIANGESDLYSFRSAYDRHILVEVISEDSTFDTPEIVQVKGKQNVEPRKPEYIQAVMDFANHFHFEFASDIEKNFSKILKYKNFNKDSTHFYGDMVLSELKDRMEVLPDDLTILGNLFIEGTIANTKLGKNLTVKGDMTVRNYDVITDGLVVEGKLLLTGDIRKVSNAKINKRLSLQNCHIDEPLSDNITVSKGCDIEIHDSHIKNIPKGLGKQCRNLLIYNSYGFKSIPDLNVGEKFALNGTSAETISENVKVGGIISISNCENLTAIPSSLAEANMLTLMNCPVEVAPFRVGPVYNKVTLVDTNIDRLQEDLSFRNLSLSMNKIKEFPETLVVYGILSLTRDYIAFPSNAKRILINNLFLRDDSPMIEAVKNLNNPNIRINRIIHNYADAKE